MTEEKSQAITIGQQIIAASSGAIITSLLMTPFDVAKIRMQQAVHPIRPGQCYLYNNGLMDHLCKCTPSTQPGLQCEWFARPGHFNGTMDAFVKVARAEGVRSLWSGLSPTLVMAVPATAFYFSLYDNLLARFRRRFGAQQPGLPLLAGVLARAAAATAVAPLEVVRTKMQSERLSFPTSFVVDGLPTIWRGLAATLMRDLPFSALYWSCYESLKARFMHNTTSMSISFMCGAVAGSAAAIVTCPFDVVKTHRQVTLGESSPSPQSTLSIMRDITRRRGIAGLFTGLVPRVCKVAPACAIMIGSYEGGKAFFRSRNEN